MLIRSKNEMNEVASIDWLEVYWTLVEPKAALKKSFLHYSVRGMWEVVSRLKNSAVSPAVAQEVYRTYNVFGLIGTPEERPVPKEISYAVVEANQHYGYLETTLASGECRVLIGEPCIDAIIPQSIDTSSFKLVVRDPEIVERKTRVVQESSASSSGTSYSPLPIRITSTTRFTQVVERLGTRSTGSEIDNNEPEEHNQEVISDSGDKEASDVESSVGPPENAISGQLPPQWK